jgi:hypothetical protein
MPIKNFTTSYLDGLKVDTRTDFQDKLVSGLRLRVSPTRTKTWACRYIRDSDGTQWRRHCSMMVWASFRE